MRLYRLLLHLYPASFRAEYGEEMCSIHAQRLRDASSIAVWLEMIFDVFWNAWRVHLDILAQDLRYAARIFGRAPGFALTAIAVAALGIGATTAAFSVVNHVLLRPLPFTDQDRLVKLWEGPPSYRHTQLSPPNYRDMKQMSTSYVAMGAYRGLM